MKYASRYESTMEKWAERLRKAENKLADSKKCLEKFGDEDSRKWVEEDTAEVERIKNNIEIVKARFAI